MRERGTEKQNRPPSFDGRRCRRICLFPNDSSQEPVGQSELLAELNTRPSKSRMSNGKVSVSVV